MIADYLTAGSQQPHMPAWDEAQDTDYGALILRHKSTSATGEMTQNSRVFSVPVSVWFPPSI